MKEFCRLFLNTPEISESTEKRKGVYTAATIFERLRLTIAFPMATSCGQTWLVESGLLLGGSGLSARPDPLAS